MSKARTTESSKPIYSEDDIILVIGDNSHDANALEAFFSKLTQELGPRILTLPHEHGVAGMDFFTFSASKSYFKYVVKLATTEAIDAALAKDPLNDQLPSPMFFILSKSDLSESDVENCTMVFQKAGNDIISAELVKVFRGVTPFHLATAYESLFVELIKKANRQAVNAAARMPINNRNVLHALLHLAYPTALETLLSR